MSAAAFLEMCIQLSMGVLCLALILTVVRVMKGPTLPDRVLALDMLVAVSIGFIAVIGIGTGLSFNVDIAIALGLVGFLSTVALARFVRSRIGQSGPESGRSQDDAS